MRGSLFICAVPIVLIGLSACAGSAALQLTSSTARVPSTMAEVSVGTDPAPTVVTTSFVAPTAANPDRSVVQDADVGDCLLTPEAAAQFVGETIDTVQTYRQPYVDGTSSDYCLYGGGGTAWVQVEMFTPVRQSAADLVAANTTTAIDAGAPAGWSPAADGVNVRILFVDGGLLGSISSLAETTTPSEQQLAAVVAAVTM